jgi:hypothetical protein
MLGSAILEMSGNLQQDVESERCRPADNDRRFP